MNKHSFIFLLIIGLTIFLRFFYLEKAPIGLYSDEAAYWFSKNVWGYIYPLFYFSYPPEKYHQEVKMSPPNEFGFGWVERFDKFFSPFPENMTDYKKTLFIGALEDFRELKKPLFSIYYPDGKVAFYIADSSSFKGFNNGRSY